MNILKTKEKLVSQSNKKKELIEVINFSNKALSIKSFAFNFNNLVNKEFENLYSFLNIEDFITKLFNEEKVNVTEEKAALHWKIRDPNSDLYKNLFVKSDVMKKRLLKGSVTNIVTLGIGGSYEGPNLLSKALNNLNNPKFNHIFITGSDNQEFKEKLIGLNQKETVFILSSKSMKSLEIINNYKLAKKWLSLKMKSSKAKENFYGITSNVREAKKLGILEKNIINLEEEIGGRYSIWSEVSLTSIIESKKNFLSFLDGGHQADLLMKSENSYKRTIKKLAYIELWNSNFLDVDNRAILSYLWKIRTLPKYLQQLEMESLGKKANLKSIFSKTSQTIYGDFGPRAQHSFFQMLHQGTSKTSVDFIIDKEVSKSNKLPKIQALTQNKLFNFPLKENLKQNYKINSNVSSNLFLLKKLTPFNLGFLISSWEHKTFISSQLLEINPFDQFGVEEGKNRISKKFS